MPAERTSRRDKSEVGDEKSRRRLRDARPLEDAPASKGLADAGNDASRVSSKKSDEQHEKAKNGDPTSVSQSRSNVQHDDRSKAAQDGRGSGHQAASERGRWRESRDEERAPRKTGSSGIRDRTGRSLAQGSDDRIWRHDKYSEVDTGAVPPAKKRRPFREEKIPAESQPTDNSVPGTGKVVHPNNSSMGTESRGERGRDHRPQERINHDRAVDRERSFSNRGRAEKSGFPSGGRFIGGNNGGRYEGRDRFDGRQGYRSTSGRAEKWKHDLYEETDHSQCPKAEEDPVAKVEALLAL